MKKPEPVRTRVRSLVTPGASGMGVNRCVPSHPANHGAFNRIAFSRIAFSRIAFRGIAFRRGV